MITTACGGCDRREPPSEPPPPGPASVASIARELGVDAEVILPPSDPLAPAGDLKADIERFVTLETCVTERAALDPLVGDALDAIGYDTFLRDACRVLEAAKRKSREPCGAIGASALRERCAEIVAIVASSPDECPLRLSERPSLGRGATCVAVAARDLRLCASEERGRRPTCEALAAGDARRCGGDERDPAVARCRRELTRFRSLLGSAPSAPRELPKPRGSLKVTAQPGAPPVAREEVDLAASLARGVVVVESFDGARAEIGGVRELGMTAHVPVPVAAMRAGATVFVGNARGADPRVEHFELDVPGGATLVCPGVKCALKVSATTLDRKRGGPFAVTIDGEIASGSRAYAVHVEASTFVRDVVTTGAASTKR